MAIPREFQTASQCPNGFPSSGVPHGTLLGLILFNSLINDIVELRTLLESLQATPSSAVQLIHLVEGMPSLGTLTGLRSGPVWTSLNLTWPRPRTCTRVGATPGIRTDRECMVWEQPCGGTGGTVWWVDLTEHWVPTTAALSLPSSNGQGREKHNYRDNDGGDSSLLTVIDKTDSMWTKKFNFLPKKQPKKTEYNNEK